VVPVEPHHGAAGRWQASPAGLGLSAGLLPVKSVGVKADLRSYEQPVMLWGTIPWTRIEAMAARVYQEVPGVNRCVVDLTGRGFGKARPLAATITRERLDLLREADALVMDGLRRHGLYREVWQCRRSSSPGAGWEGARVLRGAARSFGARHDRAAGHPPTEAPGRVWPKFLMKLDGVSSVALDVTTKPPGTIEWE